MPKQKEKKEVERRKVERVWEETKIYYLPLMPTEQDEKDVRI